MHNLPAHDSVTARIGSARLHASPPVLLRGIEALDACCCWTLSMLMGRKPSVPPPQQLVYRKHGHYFGLPKSRSLEKVFVPFYMPFAVVLSKHDFSRAPPFLPIGSMAPPLFSLCQTIKGKCPIQFCACKTRKKSGYLFQFL